MADDEPKLTPEDKEIIKEWLTERAPGPCSSCTRNNWLIADHLVAPPITAKSIGGMYAGTGKSYPLCMVICAHCGLTRFYNAVLMEVSPNEASQPDARDGGDPTDGND